MIQHEPCASRNECYHVNNARRSFELHGNPATPEGCVKGGRIGGHIQGRKNVESGHAVKALLKARTVLESNPEIRREAGCITGRKMVESGQLDRIRNLPQTKLAQQKIGRVFGQINGRIQGRKNVETGHLAEARKKAHAVCNANPEFWRKIGRIGGRISGRKAFESGRIARISRGVPSTVDGILFRSQTEAMFYCVAKELDGEPSYEPYRIELSDGTSYHPDFVLGKSILGFPANTPIELKPERNANNGNTEKAIRAGAVVVYWNELIE